MIVTIASSKGGTGKTTIAVSMAAMRATEGGRVLLVDADKTNRHTTYWAEDRIELHPELPTFDNIELSGKTLGKTIASMADDYDHIIIDCGGHDDPNWRYASAVAHKLIIPMRPAQFDTWSFNRVEDTLNQILIVNPNLEYHVLWSLVDTRTNEVGEASDMISEFEIPVAPVCLPGRKIHRDATREGMCASEIKRSGSSEASARRELTEVYDFIFHGKVPNRMGVGL